MTKCLEESDTGALLLNLERRLVEVALDASTGVLLEDLLGPG